ncbi:hypothetical protein AUK22_09245 [bacterium CG2_30_54_10]|nr:MAG: hypothetical protein AUK22_09245 [bacterium CG2_30_54_10]
MTDQQTTTINKDLLFWSTAVVVELFIIAVLTGAVWVLLGIFPMFYWPIKDAINWPIPRKSAKSADAANADDAADAAADANAADAADAAAGANAADAADAAADANSDDATDATDVADTADSAEADRADSKAPSNTVR